MLTLSAAFSESFARASVAPIFRCVITADSTDFVSYSALNSPATMGSTLTTEFRSMVVGFEPPSAIAMELDPLTRKAQTSAIHVNFLDTYLRDIITAHHLINKKITFTLGAPDMALADFAPYFSGVIQSFKPDGGNLVLVECLDAVSLIRKQTTGGDWLNQHPLDVITDLLSRAKVPTSLIDTTSFDPDAAQNDPISHFTVSRLAIHAKEGQNTVLDDEIAAFVDELCSLCGGGIIVGEDGKLRFQLFDSTDTAQDNLTADDIAEFSVEDMTARIINRVTFRFGGKERLNIEAQDYDYSPEHNDEYRFIANNTQSQADHAYPGETARVLEYETRPTWWIQASGVELPGRDSSTSGRAGLDDVATSCEVLGSFISGTREMIPGPQPAGAVASTSKPVYLQFIRWRPDLAAEIIKVTGIVADQSSIDKIDAIDAGNGSHTYIDMPGKLTLTFSRGALGTPADYHNPTSFDQRVIDLTIPEYVTNQILSRFAYGISIVRVRVSLSKYALQIGDLVTLTWPRFVGYGLDGVTSSTKWEIIGKEVDLSSGNAGINLKLATATTYTPTTTRLTKDYRGISANKPDMPGGKQGATVGRASILTGLKPTPVGGLGINIGRGTTISGTKIKEITSSPTLTMPTNSTVLITSNTVTGAIGTKSAALGSPTPSISANEVVIGKVTTGVSSITNVTQVVAQLKPLTDISLNKTNGGTGLVANSKLGLASRR